MDKLSTLIDSLILRHLPAVFNRAGVEAALREAYKAGRDHMWNGSELVPPTTGHPVIAVLHTGAVREGTLRLRPGPHGQHPEFSYQPEGHGHKATRHVPWSMISKWCYKPE